MQGNSYSRLATCHSCPTSPSTGHLWGFWDKAEKQLRWSSWQNQGGIKTSCFFCSVTCAQTRIRARHRLAVFWIWFLSFTVHSSQSAHTHTHTRQCMPQAGIGGRHGEECLGNLLRDKFQAQYCCSDLVCLPLHKTSMHDIRRSFYYQSQHLYAAKNGSP